MPSSSSAPGLSPSRAPEVGPGATRAPGPAPALTPGQSARVSHISPLRLAPYLSAKAGSPVRALSLYEWNVATSAAAYGVLHRFEVGLRNTMNRHICAWNATQIDPSTGQPHGEAWLLDPSHLLRRLAKKAIEEATPRADRAVKKGPSSRAMLHDDVLAATSLGTWRYLLPDNDRGRQKLWTDSLHRAFPHLPEGSDGRIVTRKVQQVLDLRNRIAHLEPLLDVSRTRRQVDAAYDVAAWIDPQLATWLRSTQRVAAALKAYGSI